MNLKFIVSSLTSLGLNPPIFSADFPEIDSIIEAFQQCISLTQKDQKSKQDMYDNIQKLQLTIKELSQTIETQESKIHDMDCENARIEKLMNNTNIKSKQERDKLSQERDSAKKEAAKLSSLCVQYSHDAKKHETAYNKLQEHLRKILGEKDIPTKNSAEFTAVLHKQGISLDSCRGDEEMLYFIKQGYHGTMKYYSEVINQLLNTVNDCFASMKEVLDRIGNAGNWGQLVLENPERFRSEVESRIKQFSSAMRHVERVKDDEEFPSSTLPYLKEIIKNYKEVIDSNILLLIKDSGAVLQ